MTKQYGAKKDAIFVPYNSDGNPEFFVGGGVGDADPLHLGAHKYNYMFHDSLA